MKDYRTLLLLLLVVVILPPVAVTYAQEEAAPAVEEDYLLVAGDQVQIIVDNHDGYFHKFDESIPVPVEGQVPLRDIGLVTLLGRSKKEISEEIELKLVEGQLLQEPVVVHVMIRAYAPREAYIWAAAPSVVALQPHKKHTLMQVLAMARVQLSVSDLRNITVRRTDVKTGKKFNIPVNLQDVTTKKEFGADIVVMPDDMIIIPLLEDRASMAHVYVLGKVNKPGRYSYMPGREKMKLTSLIALSGDFHQFAEEGRIRILRQKRSGTEIIKLDFDDILDGTIEDLELHPDDVVYVPESFF